MLSSSSSVKDDNADVEDIVGVGAMLDEDEGASQGRGGCMWVAWKQSFAGDAPPPSSSDHELSSSETVVSSSNSSLHGGEF